MKQRWLRHKSLLSMAVMAATCFAVPSAAQAKPHPIPRVVQSNGRYALMGDGAPFLIFGAQAKNSSDWPTVLPAVWPAIEYMHANTLEIAI